MSRRGDIELDFGDGTYRFALRIGELEELQDKCKAGPPVILQRLSGAAVGEDDPDEIAALFGQTQSWRIQDVAETIRLGLIGGGQQPVMALTLVRRYVHDRPDWFTNAKLAFSILAAALMGVEEDEPGKSAGEAATASPDSPKADGASPDSIEQPEPSDTPPQTSGQ